MQSRFILATVMLLFTAFSANAADWWQLILYSCSPSDCYDFGVGIGRVSLHISGTCSGGAVYGAQSSVQSQCANGIMDVGGYTPSYQTQVLTSSGWVQRWIDGVGADAHGVSGSNSWDMFDEHFCDDYRITVIPPAVPCQPL